MTPVYSYPYHSLAPCDFSIRLDGELIRARIATTTEEFKEEQNKKRTTLITKTKTKYPCALEIVIQKNNEKYNSFEHFEKQKGCK